MVHGFERGHVFTEFYDFMQGPRFQADDHCKNSAQKPGWDFHRMTRAGGKNTGNLLTGPLGVFSSGRSYCLM